MPFIPSPELVKSQWLITIGYVNAISKGSDYSINKSFIFLCQNLKLDRGAFIPYSIDEIFIF